MLLTSAAPGVSSIDRLCAFCRACGATGMIVLRQLGEAPKPGAGLSSTAGAEVEHLPTRLARRAVRAFLQPIARSRAA